MLKRGSLDLRFYDPARIDHQTPHDQDELYIVVSGSGRYRLAGETVSFQPGDALFAPAGVEHRFEDFTEDFATWVLFHGPLRGEHADDEL